MKKIGLFAKTDWFVFSLLTWGVGLSILFAIIGYQSYFEDPSELQVVVHSLLILLTAFCFIIFPLHRRLFSLLATLFSLLLLGTIGFNSWDEIDFILGSSLYFGVILLAPSLGLLFHSYSISDRKIAK